ncbi:hypothetical protein [Burkholderia phage CSP3]|nr:hypothetical protein [Burkholderia phage CSP3]
MARGDLNASQTGPNSRGDALTDRLVETSIIRVLVNKFGLSERTVQSIQELAGLRGQLTDGSRPREAVRHEDLGAISRMSEMKSKQVNAPPTAADFNALREDVRMLFEAMRTIAQRL